MKKILFLIAFFATCQFANAQILKPVKWSYAGKRVADNGPTKTVFSFSPSKDFDLNGKTLEPKAITHYDKMFKMNVGYFENTVVFQQKIIIKSKGKITVKGELEFGVCDDKQCLPPDLVEFTIGV